MPLAFRGQTYPVLFPVVELADPTESTPFLGQRYQLKQPTVTQRQPITNELAYRGIQYIC